MRFRHVSGMTTVKPEDEFGRQAVEELNLQGVINQPLHPEVANDIMRSIEDRAHDLQREAEEKKFEEEQRK